MRLGAENYVSLATVRRMDWTVWGAVTFLVLLWLGLIVGAPLLKNSNLEAAANYIYTPFSYVCHQIDARSFHLANEKMAVCARCLGVYAGFFAGLLVFPFARSLHEPDAPPRVILLLAPVPTAIDAVLGFSGIWENTHFSRFATGAILGAVCAFFVVPGAVEINLFFKLKNKKKENAGALVQQNVGNAPSDYSRPDLRI